MDCPICSKEYSLSKIEEHVEKCLSAGNDNDKNSANPQTKRTFPFEDNEIKPAEKKLKIKASSQGKSSKDIKVSERSKNENYRSNNLRDHSEPKNNINAIMNEKKIFNPTKNSLRDKDKNDKSMNFLNVKKNPNPSMNALRNLAMQGEKNHLPLAEKIRPSSLLGYIGQKQLLGPQTVLRRLLDNGEIPSMILWGPPGCGKTSLANVIAKISKQSSHEKTRFVKLSATSSGISDIKEAVSTAAKELKMGCRTIVFMDEIHRFNKLQQDIFLPHVEAGTFVLIGATIENPYFSLNSALLSRCRVFILEKFTKTDILTIIDKGVCSLGGQFLRTKQIHDNSNAESSNVEHQFFIDEEAAMWLAENCNGNARVALGGLEIAVKSRNPLGNECSTLKKPFRLTIKDLKAGLEKTHTLSERKCDINYDLISAMQKSVRAGDENASLYWLARLMDAGEDPVFIARRLMRVASEDVGMDDPEASDIAVHTMHACQMIGMPECDVMLGQCAIYLARASKSHLVDEALRKVQKIVMEHKGPQPSVPFYIRDRGGERKLPASLGAERVNSVRKKEEGTNRLPAGLENLNFFK